MDPAAAKQQISERVKQANKFLVTVNSSPTVDQLAACIGLTLLLNKMGKHATAVFSGKVPSTIEFLKPEKTIQPNTDSLRDFIISLDKNKADKLRYKVEDQFVRIFITPYRSSISEKDLVFSEGDFNVEVVIALGVKERTQLDAAITAHGRILHDATVVSVNTGKGKAPDIGQINWLDEQASSLCEMLVSISESFGTGLIDNQMATAFLTGIVAETERFSNPKTSPKVMTMSAQLMAAGANQQLIVNELEPPESETPPLATPPKQPAPQPKQPQKPTQPEGEIDLSQHRKEQPPTTSAPEPTQIHIDEQGNLLTKQDLAKAQPVNHVQTPPPAGPTMPTPVVNPPSWMATQAPAPENSSDTNKPHSYLSKDNHSPMADVSFTSNTGGSWAAPYDLLPVDPLNDVTQPLGNGAQALSAPAPVGNKVPEIKPPATQIQSSVTPVAPSNVDSARNAVESALASAPDNTDFPEPITSLNAQPIDLEPAPTDPNSAGMPKAQPNDTPSLNLPFGETPFTPPPASSDSSDVAPPAPPPVPPPIMP